MNQSNNIKAVPENLLKLVASIQEPAFLQEKGGRIAWANLAALRLFGLSESEMIGKSPSEALEPKGQGMFDRQFEKIAQGDQHGFMTTVTKKDGSELDLSFHFSHLANGSDAYLLSQVEAEQNHLPSLHQQGYQELLEAIESGVFVLVDDHIRFANRYFCELTGFSEAELIGKSLFDLIHHKDLHQFSRKYRNRDEMVLGGDEFEFRIHQKDGLVVYVYMVLGEIKFEGRDAMAASVNDITMRKIIEEENEKYALEIKEQYAYVDNLIERLPLGAWIIDFSEEPCQSGDPFCKKAHEKLGFSVSITRVNKALAQMMGFSKREMVGASIFDPRFVDEKNANIFLENLTQRRQGKRGSYEIEVKHRSGRIIPILLEAIPTVFESDHVMARQAIGLMVDLTESKAAEAEMKRLNEKLTEFSKTDALTGLANRRNFDEYLGQEINRAIREKWDLSLILIDIDFFKKYNDGYGHLAGDQCLQGVAEAFRSVVKRAIDLCARYGGEEFAVILPSTSTEGALKVGESLRAAVAAAQIPHAHSAAAPFVTISAGVSTMRAGEKFDADRLIVLADEGLYQSKTDGRNRVTAALRRR